MKLSLVVHPVSYSPSGNAALRTAVALARASGADLHVLELTGRWSSAGPIVRPITDPDVEPHFAEFVRSVYSADVKIGAVELVGDVVDAVVDYARSTFADLVVVADQARSHGPYRRRGMYANDLARHLSIPLVSVPASRDEMLARPGGSSEEAKSHAEVIARIIGLSRSAKAKTAGDGGADLIVVARPGEHHHVSMNSALARVLRNASRPVLVLPATAADQTRVPPTTVARVREAAISR